MTQKTGLSRWLIDARNGPDFDLERPSAPRRTYIVAATQRTGSTLLCRTLWDLRLVGAPAEYLNPIQLRDWEVRMGSPRSRALNIALSGALFPLIHRADWNAVRLAHHLERVAAHRTGPSGWFGIQLHHDHLVRWVQQPALDLEAALGSIRWVHLRRDDRVAQAVSWARAIQTDQWFNWQKVRREPNYDYHLIAQILSRIDQCEAAWTRMFRERGIEPLTLTYEQLVADRAATARSVLTYLGLPEADRIDIAKKAPMDRQGDAINAEWIARFRSEWHRALPRPQPKEPRKN